MVVCARGCPERSTLALQVLQLAWFVREHPAAPVRQAALAVLHLLTRVIAVEEPGTHAHAAPVGMVQRLLQSSRDIGHVATVAESVVAMRTWFVHTRQHDPDAGCRDVATHALLALPQ